MLMKPIPDQRIEDRNKVLTTAAELIEKKGWCQGVGLNAQGQFCTVGAIATSAQRLGFVLPVDREVATFGHATSDVEADAYAAVSAVIGNKFITEWNDNQFRMFGIGKRRVVAALRSATEQPLVDNSEFLY